MEDDLDDDPLALRPLPRPKNNRVVERSVAHQDVSSSKSTIIDEIPTSDVEESELVSAKSGGAGYWQKSSERLQKRRERLGKLEAEKLDESVGVENGDEREGQQDLEGDVEMAEVNDGKTSNLEEKQVDHATPSSPNPQPPAAAQIPVPVNTSSSPTHPLPFPPTITPFTNPPPQQSQSQTEASTSINPLSLHAPETSLSTPSHMTLNAPEAPQLPIDPDVASVGGIRYRPPPKKRKRDEPAEVVEHQLPEKTEEEQIVGEGEVGAAEAVGDEDALECMNVVVEEEEADKADGKPANAVNSMAVAAAEGESDIVMDERTTAEGDATPSDPVPTGLADGKTNPGAGIVTAGTEAVNEGVRVAGVRVNAEGIDATESGVEAAGDKDIDFPQAIMEADKGIRGLEAGLEDGDDVMQEEGEVQPGGSHETPDGEEQLGPDPIIPVGAAEGMVDVLHQDEPMEERVGDAEQQAAISTNSGEADQPAVAVAIVSAAEGVDDDVEMEFGGFEGAGEGEGDLSGDDVPGEAAGISGLAEGEESEAADTEVERGVGRREEEPAPESDEELPPLMAAYTMRALSNVEPNGGIDGDADDETTAKERQRARMRSESLSPPPPDPHEQAPVTRAPAQASSPVAPAAAPFEIPTTIIPNAALAAFQHARTFRRRTAIQLQPYTREKTKYTAMVKKGGKLLIAELLHDDPDREAIARIMAGQRDLDFGTGNSDDEDDPELDMAISPLVKPTDKDYDEYFRIFGEVADTDDDPRLQNLAKLRMKEEKKEERKRQRQEKEARKYMEALRRKVREREREEKEKERVERDKEKAERDREKAEKRRLREEKAREKAGRQQAMDRARESTPVQARAEDRHVHMTGKRKRIVSSDEDDDTPARPDHTSSRSNRSIATPLSARRDNSHTVLDSPGPLSPARMSAAGEDQDLEHMDFGGFGGDDWFDDEREPSVQMLPPISPSGSTPAVDSVAPEGSDTDAPVVPREKVRALKHMMPAAQARRLAARAEAEYQARQRRLAGQAVLRDEQAQARPGLAISKRGHGHGGGNAIADLFDDEDVEEVNEMPHYAQEAIPDPMITILSSDDDSDIASVSEQSVLREDDLESVRHLRAGNFAALLHGPRPARRLETAARTSRTLLRRTALPVQALDRGAKPPPRKKARLSNGKNTARTGGATVRSKARPRLAILDDQTIFAREASPPSHGLPLRSPLPQPIRAAHILSPALTSRDRQSPLRPSAERDNRHAPSSPVSVGAPWPTHPPVHAVDLWNDLKDFQIDFAMKPLLHGVSVDPGSDVGSGSFASRLRYLAGGVQSAEPVAITAYGVDLGPDMTMSSLVSVLPALFTKIVEHIAESLSGSEQTGSSNRVVTVLRFLSGYVARHAIEDEQLRELQSAIQALEVDLKAFSVPRPSRGQLQGWRTLVETKLCVLEAYILLARLERRLEFPTSYDYANSVLQTSLAVLSSLLQAGFDKTMKPLKAIMADEADSGVIGEPTVEFWIKVLQLMQVWESLGSSLTVTFANTLIDRAVEAELQRGETGPRASERIWYLAFGLAALRQFDANGAVASELVARPTWALISKAIVMVNITPLSEDEENIKRYQLKARDKYIKIMVIRCLKLANTWQWRCTPQDFAIATKDIGTIFKARNLRNLPNEPAGDFPAFIAQFDRGLVEDIDIEDTAYNLYLQFVCICASDIINCPSSLEDAESVVKDVQRLMLAVIPFSPVRFGAGKIPSGKALSALVNRYSTAVVVALFDIDLLAYLLGNAKRWVDFATADIESRRTCIRGLMYLGVAARHHRQSLRPVIAALASCFEGVEAEKNSMMATKAEASAIGDRERLLVLIVGCHGTLMTMHSYDKETQQQPLFPDPAILDKSWTGRLRSTELVTDRQTGLEVVACVQKFLDERARALPARQRRYAKIATVQQESQDSEFGEMGLDISDADLLALGVGEADVAPEITADVQIAPIIAEAISPGIYALLSNTFSTRPAHSTAAERAERQIYISALTKCWAECASIIVVDHRLRDWNTYLAYGSESWERLSDEIGRRQVGMNFMLNAGLLDPQIFQDQPEQYILLLLQALVAHEVTVEVTFVDQVIRAYTNMKHPLLSGLSMDDQESFSRTEYLAERTDFLRTIFTNIGQALRSSGAQPISKPFIYRCINQTLATMQTNFDSIELSRTNIRDTYHAFTNETIRTLRHAAGASINETTIPKLKQFPLGERQT